MAGLLDTDTAEPAAAPAPAPADAGGGSSWWQDLPNLASRVGLAVGGGLDASGMSTEQQATAGRRALLSFGMNMLAGAGWSPVPRSFGEITAQGLSGAMQSNVLAEQQATQRGTTAANLALRQGQLQLSQQGKAVQLALLKMKLDQLQAGRAAARSALTEAGGGQVDLSDAPPEATTLLQRISELESHNNPKALYGGGEFEGNQFPDWQGRPTPDGADVSHAAGQYQFQPGTWQRVQAANPDIKDFSAANQHKGAWWLAQNDYKERTGRELATDLKDPSKQATIYAALAPTWPTLGPLATAGGAPAVKVATAAPSRTTDVPPTARPAPPPATPAPAPETPPVVTPPAEATPPSLASVVTAQPPPITGQPRDDADVAQQRIDLNKTYKQELRAAAAAPDPTAAMRQAQDNYRNRVDALNKEMRDRTESQRTEAVKQVEAERVRRAGAAEAERVRLANLEAEQAKEGRTHQQQLDLERMKQEATLRANKQAALLDVDKKRLIDAGTTADSAREQRNNLDQLATLIPDLGAAQPISALNPEAQGKMIAVLQGLGLGTEAQNKQWDTQTAYLQIINRIAGNLRPIGSGQLSDKEMGQYRNAFGSLAQTPEGRMISLGLMRLTVDRKLQEQEFKQNYFREHETTSGMERALDTELGPLVDKPPPATAPPAEHAAYMEKQRGRSGVPFFMWDPRTSFKTRTWAIFDESGKRLLGPQQAAP